MLTWSTMVNDQEFKLNTDQIKMKITINLSMLQTFSGHKS